MSPKRNRPRFSATVLPRTLHLIDQIANENALPNRGVALDFIVNDRERLKHAAIQSAAPAQPIPEEAA